MQNQIAVTARTGSLEAVSSHLIKSTRGTQLLTKNLSKNVRGLYK